MNSKLHAVCDGRGRPLIMLLSEGQMSDFKGAASMLAALPRARELLGDKGYDADWFRQALAERGITACIEKAAILNVIHEEPAFSEMFIAHLLGRTIRVEADLIDQLFNSSEKRLARLLLLLANFGKDDKPEPMIAKISQETLAEMIGTTRSRVSFFMNKFRRLGFIDYNGGIEVHSSLLNLVLHEEPHIET